MKDLIIGVDVDGVLADFIGKVLYYQNSIYKTNFKHSDITSYHIEDIIGESNVAVILELLENNHDAKYFDVLPGAIELIRDLNELGRVVFVTAPCPRYRGWADDRLFWLKKNFSAKRDDILSLKDKTLFAGYILIDDSSINIKSWLDINKPAIRISQPWNQDGLGIVANNLSEVRDIVAEIKYCYEFMN